MLLLSNFTSLYSIMNLLGYFFCVLIIFINSKKTNNNFYNVAIFYFMLIFVGLIGGNIYHNLVYNYNNWNYQSQSIFGSILLIELLYLTLLNLNKTKYLMNLDIVLIGFAFQLSLGKIGCYGANCCYGNLHFFNYILPLQIIDSLSYLTLGVLLFILFINNKLKTGTYSFVFFIGFNIIRLHSELNRGENSCNLFGIKSTLIIGLFFIFALSLNFLFKTKNSNKL